MARNALQSKLRRCCVHCACTRASVCLLCTPWCWRLALLLLLLLLFWFLWFRGLVLLTHFAFVSRLISDPSLFKMFTVASPSRALFPLLFVLQNSKLRAPQSKQPIISRTQAILFRVRWRNMMTRDIVISFNGIAIADAHTRTRTRTLWFKNVSSTRSNSLLYLRRISRNIYTELMDTKQMCM